ncbi:hypothetical protein KC953_00870 [Candidatus Saccharibacteria bacterium]|nr:hypothetical protein [Candidatus Saccharibacteria bacterium]
MRRVFLAIVLTMVGAATGLSQSVSAYQSDDKQFINGDNIFYVYVKAGEKLSASFLRSIHSESGGVINPPQVDVTITIDAPGLKQQKCVAKANVAVGKGCIFKQQTAAKTGIWRVQFVTGKGAKIFTEGFPDVRWGKNFFSWNITVNGLKADIQQGRLWTERYSFRQPIGQESTGDFEHFYVSEDGYIYKAIEYGYNGQVSMLSADSIGIRKMDECVSVYQSIEVDNDEFSPAFGACGNTYKLFFEEPAGDLPQKATRWDGTEDWVRPNIERPSLSELHFTSNKSADQQSGTISYFLHNFIGQYDIKIDVDNDGSFEGQSDVTLHQQMKSLSDGLQHVYFQGVDRRGQVIPPSQKIGIKVVITKVAEIHFVATDVEGRQGLEVTRLNGDNAPTNRLCWNDTELSTIKYSRFATDTADGRSCPESRSGVHGWQYNSKSWGNARYIDDWIYATAKLDGDNQIVYPEDKVAVAEKSTTNWLLIGGVAVGLVAAVAGVVVVLRHLGKSKTPDVMPSAPPTPPTPPGIQPIGSQDPTALPPQDQDRY